MVGISMTHTADRPSILVVDEDEHIISAFEEFLRQENYRMISASTMEEALKISAVEEPTLLITDVRNQNHSALHLIRQYKSDHRGVPVIVMTGYPELIEPREKSLTEFDVLLLKPLELKSLRDAIRNLLA